MPPPGALLLAVGAELVLLGKVPELVLLAVEDGGEAGLLPPTFEAQPPTAQAAAITVTAAAKCREFIRATLRGGHRLTRRRVASLT